MRLLLLALLTCCHQSSGFLLGPPVSSRPHKAIMLLKESSQEAVDAKMEDTYASLVDRLMSRYERQSAANELQNNQLFVGKIDSSSADDTVYFFLSG